MSFLSLILILFLYLVALLVSVAVSYLFKTTISKVLTFACIFSVTTAGIFADHVLGERYCDELGGTKAGIYIYEQLETIGKPQNGVEAHLIFPDGHKDSGELNWQLLSPYVEENRSTEVHSSLLGIIERRYAMRDPNTKAVYGEYISYDHLGGWLHRFSSGISYRVCGRVDHASKRLVTGIFKGVLSD